MFIINIYIYIAVISYADNIIFIRRVLFKDVFKNVLPNSFFRKYVMESTW